MRLKRKSKVLIAIALVGIGVGTYAAWQEPETELVTYEKEVDVGDTVWSICGRIATDKEDMGKLVWQTMKDNNITDPGNLQPGQKIIIHVKEAREGA